MLLFSFSVNVELRSIYKYRQKIRKDITSVDNRSIYEGTATFISNSKLKIIQVRNYLYNLLFLH